MAAKCLKLEVLVVNILVYKEQIAFRYIFDRLDSAWFYDLLYILNTLAKITLLNKFP